MFADHGSYDMILTSDVPKTLAKLQACLYGFLHSLEARECKKGERVVSLRHNCVDVISSIGLIIEKIIRDCFEEVA